MNESYSDRLDEEKIYRRYYVLSRQALRIKAAVLQLDDATYEEIEAAPGIWINQALLFGAIESYWFDIFRLRDFHNDPEGLVNRPRKAAYTVKWLTRYKPISFDASFFTSKEDCSFLCMINEYFAYRAGVRYAGLKDDMLDTDTMDRFIYNLHFRSYDEGFVSMWFWSMLKANGLPIR